MSALVKAVATLLDVMSSGEREAVSRQLALYGAAPITRGGSLLRFVSGLFTPGACLSVDEIVHLAAEKYPDAPRKQVYNALGYLTRRKAIRRAQRGLYEAARKSLTPESQEKAGA